MDIETVDVVDIRIGGVHGIVLVTEDSERYKLIIVKTNGKAQLTIAPLPKDEA